MRDTAGLRDTKKQTQGGCQNEEARKRVPNETRGEISGKRTKQMETSKLLDAGFKTLVIRMLKELTENFKGIKKAQSEMKDTLTEMKKNL